MPDHNSTKPSHLHTSISYMYAVSLRPPHHHSDGTAIFN
jgi:hypothetical protein